MHQLSFAARLASPRKIISAALVLFALVIPAHKAAANTIYSTDFQIPPWVVGNNLWGGFDGWIADDTLNQTQGILDGGNGDGVAFIGFNPTTEEQLRVRRNID